MKKHIALFLAVAMLFTMSFSVSAFELDAVESSVEMPAEVAEPEQSEAEVYAAVTTAPGLNMLTGTADTLDFETEGTFPITFPGKLGTNMSVVDNDIKDTVAGNTSNKVLKTQGTGLRYEIMFLNVATETGRMYEINWDTYVTVKYTGLCGWILNFNQDNSHVGIPEGSPWKVANVDKNEWYSHSYTSTAQAKNEIQIQYKLAPDEEYNESAVYVDNVSVYPYYKITYVDGQGTPIETLQILRGEDGQFLTSYTVKSDNYPEWDVKDGTVRECIGWAVTPGAADKVTEVALKNADITLYPVWKTTEYLTASADSSNASAGKSITVTATEPVDWTYDVGATDATVSDVTETTITFNAVGYAGEIAVTATLKSDNKVSVKKTVDFYSGPLYKPGLNIYTGTTEAYGFEEEDWYETAGWNDDGNVERIENPEKDGINPSDYAVTYKTQFAVLHTKTDLNPKMEIDRPVYVSFDYRAGGPGYTQPGNTVYFMVNNIAGGANGNIYRSMALSNNGVWENKTFTVDITKGGNESTYLEQTITKDGGVKWLGIESMGGIDGTNKFLNVDNVNMIPYYKVTYMSLDGSSVAATEYVLLDSEGNFLSGYTPDISKVPGATGFALEQGGESVTVVPLENKDIVLYPVTTRQISFMSDVSSKTEVIEDGEGYTFKDPADFGFATENFLVWYAEGVGKYKPGDALSAEQIDKIVGTIFVAYYQDVNVPAMGFAFEGTSKQTGEQKLSYSELIEDDGRSVLHLNQYQSTYEAANPAEGKAPKWMSDMRIHIKNANTKFDPKEYNIVQYMYRVDNMVSLDKWTTALEDLKPEDLIEHTQADMIIYYYTGEAGDAFYNPGGEHRVGNKIFKVDDNGEYNMIEVDMSDPANGNSTAPWTYGEFVYGFAVDPNRVNYSGDTYIDYLRVYRDGIFTVTYDSNAPEYYEDWVENEVAPDTGRGVGTGYLLKGERPEIDGFIFRGWALTPDATADEVVDSVDLKGDLTVYAVWEAALYNTAPDMDNFAGIRSGADKVNGIRFRSVIDANTKEFMDEYGFIVARKDVLGDKELTFEFKKEGTGTPLYATGVAYNKDEGIDIQYSVETNGDTVFTAVCVGIPDAHFSTELVARAYAKYSNKNGLAFTVYGSPITRSIAQVAKAVRDANGEDYANNQEYIDYILETVGAQS